MPYAGEKFDTALRHLARAEKLEPDSLETKILRARIYMDDQNEAGSGKNTFVSGGKGS